MAVDRTVGSEDVAVVAVGVVLEVSDVGEVEDAVVTGVEVDDSDIAGVLVPVVAAGLLVEVDIVVGSVVVDAPATIPCGVEVTVLVVRSMVFVMYGLFGRVMSTTYIIDISSFET